MTEDFTFDWDRAKRSGLPEAVLAEPKSVAQVRAIADAAVARAHPLLITRVRPDQAAALQDLPFTYDPASRTAVHAVPPLPKGAPLVGIVTAGTSDLPVAREAQVTARFLGLETALFADLGVAGLWRLQSRLDEIVRAKVVIAVAGMEGALFSVLPGLIHAPVIAVPTSVGYGVGAGGQVALQSALATCAPGLVTVNIDNGFGAAAAAAKMLRVS